MFLIRNRFGKFPVLFLLVTIFVFPAFHTPVEAAGKSISILPHQENSTGSLIAGVFIENLEEMTSGSFELEFDPTIITFESAKETSLLQGFIVITNDKDSKSGKVKFAFASDRAFKQNGNIIDLKLKIVKKDVDALIEISNLEIYDKDGREINVQAGENKLKAFKEFKLKDTKPVDSQKEWKVKFNVSLSSSTVNEKTVYIVNSQGLKERATVKLEDNNRTIKVRPVNQLASGKYTLYITQQVNSSKYGAIKDAIKMNFSVQ